MTYALDIQNLCKTYASGVVALNDASFKVQSGDFLPCLAQTGGQIDNARYHFFTGK